MYRIRTEDPDYASTQSFSLPQEVFAARPSGAAIGDMGGLTGAAEASRAAPGTSLDDLFGPAVPVSGSEFLAGTGLETLEAPAADYGGQFGEQ